MYILCACVYAPLLWLMVDEMHLLLIKPLHSHHMCACSLNSLTCSHYFFILRLEGREPIGSSVWTHVLAELLATVDNWLSN